MTKSTKKQIESLDKTIEILNGVQNTIINIEKNMAIMNDNVQGSIDQIEDIQKDVDKMRKRMGI